MARTDLFPVYRMEMLGAEEERVSGTATNGVECTIWTSEAPIAGEKAFYKVKVVPAR